MEWSQPLEGPSPGVALGPPGPGLATRGATPPHPRLHPRCRIFHVEPAPPPPRPPSPSPPRARRLRTSCHCSLEVRPDGAPGGPPAPPGCTAGTSSRSRWGSRRSSGRCGRARGAGGTTASGRRGCGSGGARTRVRARAGAGPRGSCPPLCRPTSTATAALKWWSVSRCPGRGPPARASSCSRPRSPGVKAPVREPCPPPPSPASSRPPLPRQGSC